MIPRSRSFSQHPKRHKQPHSQPCQQDKPCCYGDTLSMAGEAVHRAMASSIRVPYAIFDGNPVQQLVEVVKVENRATDGYLCISGFSGAAFKHDVERPIVQDLAQFLTHDPLP